MRRLTVMIVSGIGVIFVTAFLTTLFPSIQRRSLGISGSKTAVCRAFPVRTANSPQTQSMIYVQGGVIRLGRDDGFPEERPARIVSVESFWIDTHEVTNAEFAAFVDATGFLTSAERTPYIAATAEVPDDFHEPGGAVFVPPKATPVINAFNWWRYVPGADWRHPGGPDTTIDGLDAYPVVQVSYEDASAYARWIGKDLPTEAQWEYAARKLGNVSDPDFAAPKKANVWQGVFPVLDTASDGYAGLAPVGCFPDSDGVYDMIGNVWEWTSDYYDNPGPGNVAQRVIKGGSYLCAENFCARYRPEARQGQDVNFSTNHIGFRLVINQPREQL